MKNKSLGLTILWWAEIVCSARILLFTIPVLIQKNQAKMFDTQHVGDWFICVITFAAMVYFLIGILSVMGHRFWRIFHYAGAAWIVFLNYGLIKGIVDANAVGGAVYYLPAIVSMVIVILVSVLKIKTV